MKIAIIRKKYTFHGGAEGIFQDFLAMLVKAGHEIHIFAIHWEGTDLSRNIHFHKVPAITFNSFIRDLSFAISSFFILKKQAHKFDIIQSHDKTLYQDICYVSDGCHIEWLKQRLRRKGLFGKLTVILNPYHWLVLTIERMIFKGHRFKKVIAMSGLIKNNIMDNYQVNGNDIVVMYHKVDLERFHPENKGRYSEEIRRRYSIGKDEFVVLFVGSGFERKGVKYLLKAAELLRYPVTVLIVGKGSENRFKRYVNRQRVIFCGPQKDVHKYYAASDVFVMPAIYEPFGLVYLEALASGIPVIATGLSGAAEIVQDGINGFIITLPEDYPTIAEKIQFLIDQREEREAMAMNARKLAESFSFAEYADEIMNLYKDIISRKKLSLP